MVANTPHMAICMNYHNLPHNGAAEEHSDSQKWKVSEDYLASHSVCSVVLSNWESQAKIAVVAAYITKLELDNVYKRRTSHWELN